MMLHLLSWIIIVFFLGINTTVYARQPSEKPNFLIFFVDDLGYGDLGITGHPTTNTPNIDKYALAGRRLTTWYSGYPVCTSSRTALLTGV